MEDRDSHNRLRRTKMFLPIVALGALSVMFFFARSPSSDLDFEFSTGEALPAGRISRARIDAVADNGAALMLQAQSAQVVEDQMEMAQVDLSMDSADGLLTARGDTGIAPLAGEQITLTGAARVISSAGLDMQSEKFVLDTRAATLSAPGPVQAQSPFGHIDAGSMQISRDPVKMSMRIDFRSGVELLYTPQAAGE